MSRRTETKGFDGGFIPPDLKTNKPRGRKESTQSGKAHRTAKRAFRIQDDISDPPQKERKTRTTQNN